MSGSESGWRYKQGDVDKGVVSWERLQSLARSGELSDVDMIFWPSRQRWVKAWEVPGLFDLQAASTSPVEDPAAARRRRILLVAIAADVAITLAVGVVLFVLIAK